MAIATSGPGSTNLVTGLATAYLDSSPVVAITGQVERRFIGTDAFQEVDIVGITIPITKHNEHIMSAGDIYGAVKRAFYLARNGRPGPVLLDIPKDVLEEESPFDPRQEVAIEGFNPILEGHGGQIKRAAKLLAQAKSPVIVAGGGVIRSRATDELLRLSRLLGAPILTTLMGKSAVPQDFEYYLGMIGMHGSRAAVQTLQGADVIAAVGARFGDRAVLSYKKFEKLARFIQIDIDPAEIEKTVEVDIPIVGDARKVLHGINNRLEKEEGTIAVREAPEARLERYDGSGPLSTPAVVQALSDRGEDSIIVTDVGRHQIWAAKYYNSPRLPLGLFITSGGLGTMGFGLPAALGAKIAHPDKKVVLITGDGSFLMNIQELATSSHHAIPVVAVVMNDRHLGMIRQLQDAFYNRPNTSSAPSRPTWTTSAWRGPWGLTGRRLPISDRLERP